MALPPSPRTPILVLMTPTNRSTPSRPNWFLTRPSKQGVPLVTHLRQASFSTPRAHVRQALYVFYDVTYDVMSTTHDIRDRTHS
jgi:hypothetical protein